MQRFRLFRVSAPLLAAALLLALFGCSFHSKQSYVEKGNRLFAEGRYEEAQILYRKALQKDQQFGEAYYRLALTDLKTNSLPEAYQALTEAVRLQPENMEAKIKLADLCFSGYRLNPNHPRNYYDQTAKLAGQILAQNPHSAAGFRLQGELALADKEPKRAIELFRQASAAAPTDAEISIMLSEAFVENGQSEEAEKTCLSLIQRDKKIGRAYEFLYALYRTENRSREAEDVLSRWTSADARNAMPYVRLARYYAETGRDKEMHATLDRILNDRKQFPHARLIVGEFYMALKRPADALAQFHAGEQDSPKDKLIYEKAAVNADLAMGHREDASTEVNTILSTNAQDEQARLVKASLLAESGKLDEAQKIYEDLSKRNEKDPARHFSLGQILAAKNDMTGARKEFIAAKSGSRTYLPPRIALTQLELQANNYREALQNADEVLAVQPANTQAHSMRVMALEGMQRYQEARTEINQLLQSNPNDAQTQLALADLDVREKRFREAEEIYSRLNKPGQQDLRPLEGLLEIRLQQNQFDSALELARRSLQLSPASSGLQQLYGDVAFRAGKTDIAMKQYEQIAAKGNVNEPVYVRLGSYYLSQGDSSKAISSFENATRVAPRDPAAVIYLSEALAAAGRKADAIAMLRHGHEIDPENPAILNNLAFFLAGENRDLDDALKMAQQASGKVQQNLEYQDTLAWVYIRKGMPQNAIPILNGLLRTSPKQAEYHFHLGAALADSGKRTEARTELETALANKPSSQDRADIQALMIRLGVS